MKTLFLLRGLPGSGKTTLANILSAALQNTVSVYAADDFLTDSDGTYIFDANKLNFAHTQCQQAVASAMLTGGDIVVHNTLTTERELRPYLELASNHAYRVISLIVENRHGSSSIHGVGPSTIARMKNRFAISL